MQGSINKGTTMRVKCIRRCQLAGFGIIAAGDVVELPDGRMDAHVKRCFDVGGSDTNPDANAEVRLPGGQDLTDAQLRVKLQELQVYVPKTAKRERLLRLYQEATEQASGETVF
mgnify:CR=1 FL=1